MKFSNTTHSNIEKCKTFEEFTTILYSDADVPPSNCNSNTVNEVAMIVFESFKKGSEKAFNIEVTPLASDNEMMLIYIISDDVAFIVDSAVNEINKQNIEIVLIAVPVMTVMRSSGGMMECFSSAYGSTSNTSKYKNEAVSVFVVRKAHNVDYNIMKERLNTVMECVFLTNRDWSMMQDLVSNTVSFIDKKIENILDKENIISFMNWLLQDNFIFLATCECGIDADKQIQIFKESSLGLLRSNIYDESELMDQDVVEHLCKSDDHVTFYKTQYYSNVHRSTNMEALYVKKIGDSSDRIDGFIVILGFFTSAAYNQSIMHIPIVRAKIDNALERYAHPRNGYLVKEIIAALQYYPRAELFQMTTDEIYSLITNLVSIVLLPCVRVLIRCDILSDFISVVLFVPKNKFGMDLYRQIEQIVCKHMNVTVSKEYVYISESHIVRLQLIVKANTHCSHYDAAAIEQQVTAIIYSWRDHLQYALNQKYQKAVANAKFNAFSDAFDNEYIAVSKTDHAILDIDNIWLMLETEQSKMFTFGLDHASNDYNFRIYSKQKVEISDILPAIENTGFAVIEIDNYVVKPIYSNMAVEIHIYKLSVRCRVLGFKISDERFNFLQKNLESVLQKAEYGVVEHDQFNSLILYAGLSWYEVIIFRAYTCYLKQLGLAYEIKIIIHTLVTNHLVTNELISLFKLKFSSFNTAHDVLASEVEGLYDEVLTNISNVESVVSDKILRAYLEIINATKRTNFYSTKCVESDFEYISFKIASSEISFAPSPKPFMEIFVYSPRFEAVHLRGGKIARGGMRWSDRHEDYRTEILGLMKAQMTKNSVIVPVGSKGGFIVKSVQPYSDAFISEGVACYKLFLCGLLDITDNFENGEVIRTKNSICWDDVDPYLVVAADKGTATFSDYANAISAQYKFWLDDAFASGGSAGYDHKELGITSRGAWISAVQHFSVLGIDPNEQEITVVGIGDMSGDVFGNGMLMSNKIRLVAAFNHMHIFIDPNPDATSSFIERKRLFNMPKSKWSDYDQKLISKGGGIFSRAVKSIALTKEMRNALSIAGNTTSISPDELISAILMAPVDLLWNGGIGTYVKSSVESNAVIGDKLNDGLRVNGSDLRCKVVVEGGNIGLTQKGRIEYARNGGCINTDFIDNSAGVDCSDHEVNLKIAFAQMVAEGKMSIEQRNALLEQMSYEITELVLEDNKLQTQILSIESYCGKEKIWEHNWLISYLVNAGELDRDVEQLLSADELSKLEKAKGSLTRPELCVILAYAKNSAIKMLENNEMIWKFFDMQQCNRLFLKYFPKKLAEHKEYLPYLENHKLRHQLMVMILVNDLINTMGCTYFHSMVVNQAIDPAILLKAFCTIKYGLRINEHWQAVIDMKGKVSNNTRLFLFKIIYTVIARNIGWLLHNKTIDMACNSTINYSTIEKLADELYSNISPKYDIYIVNEIQLIKDILGEGEINDAMMDLLRRICAAQFAFDMIDMSHKYKIDISKVFLYYNMLRSYLHLDLVNARLGRVFFDMKYDVKSATRLLMRSIDTLLMRLTKVYIHFADQNGVIAHDIKCMGEICSSKALDTYHKFIDDSISMHDWNSSDGIIAMLVLLKKHLRNVLHSVTQ